MGFSFKTFTAETLTASDLNAQFAKIENKFGNIKNVDIAADAGITSQKLLDRYVPVYQTMVLRGIDVDDAGNVDIWGDTGAVITAQNVQSSGSATTIRLDLTFPSKRAYLCAIVTHVAGYTAGSTDDMTIWFLHNGTEINALDITATNTTYYIRAGSSGSDAFASPFLALQDGDYIEIAVGNQVSGEVPTARAITVTLAYKVELIS